MDTRSSFRYLYIYILGIGINEKFHYILTIIIIYHFIIPYYRNKFKYI